MKKSEAYRCSICPAVSDPALRNNPDDPVCVIFHPDPKSPQHFICDACASEIGLNLSEMFQSDDEQEFNYTF